MGASLEWSARTRRQDQHVPLRGAACVIEPNEAQREHITSVLCGLGFVTHETALGEVGAFIAEQVSLRAVVVNVLTPGTPGLQLIRYIRQRAPAATIVSISDRVRTSMPVMLSRMAGADAALVAPVSAETLAMVLDDVEPIEYGPPPASGMVRSVIV